MPAESFSMIWELRALLLLSLSLQIVLILFGNQRKYSSRIWVRIVLWLAYMSADWTATVALGILCKNQGHTSDGGAAITAFWTPFLLLHLGGPDTITAYSLEDNELWLRHFLGLLVQVGTAFYILVRCWIQGTSHLIILAIPIFIAGIIKYGERTWCLRSSSYDHFGHSSLPSAIQKRSLFHNDDGFITSAEGGETPGTIAPEAQDYHDAIHFFKKFKRLYSDLIFPQKFIQDSQDFFVRGSHEEAFRVIELELGFMYDVLFTKAPAIWSGAGWFLRCVSFFSTVATFVAFTVTDKNGYSGTDVKISYALLVGAMTLDVYAITWLLFSDWAVLWSIVPGRGRIMKSICGTIRRLILAVNSSDVRRKRWSSRVAQFNLINFCWKNWTPMFLDCCNDLQEQLHVQFEDVSTEMKEFIFRHVVGMARLSDITEMSRRRGEGVIEKFLPNRSLEKFDFEATVLILHIATDLSHYSDLKAGGATSDSTRYLRISKYISEYMMYLMVMCPFMLPKGMGKIWFQLTVNQTTDYFRDVDRARNHLIKGRWIKDEVPSLVRDGCQLEKALRQKMGMDDKWKMICGLWAEMLCYAANQCGWKVHAQQLGTGGELLTHVSLLIAHLGLPDQVRIVRSGPEIPRLPMPKKAQVKHLFKLWLRAIQGTSRACPPNGGTAVGVDGLDHSTSEPRPRVMVRVSGGNLPL